jgi:hypothetical protein
MLPAVWQAASAESAIEGNGSTVAMVRAMPAGMIIEMVFVRLRIM